MTNRTTLPTFALENPLYSVATVTVFGITPTGQKDPANVVTLYDAPTGTGTLQNPQQLDSTGKWEFPPYVDEPVVISVTGEGFDDHDTGVLWAGYTWRDAWATTVNYVTNDIMQALAGADDSGDLYIAVTAHQSGVFATDVTAGKIAKILDISSLIDPVSAAFLLKAENLSDLADAATARTNLELGTSATEDTGTVIGNVPQLIDGGAVATMPAVNAELLTNTIAGQTVGNVVDPATDLVAFYDDSASENRQTIIQTILDLVPDPPVQPRAWVQFNASGTILGSEGVTSVTKNATGDFTINFTVAWASGNDYAISALAQRPSNNNDIKCAIKIGTTPTATAVNIVTVDAAANLLDPSLCMVTAMGTQ